MAHLPIAVSLLLLEVFFMQRSGVSLTLTWPCRFCLFRVLLDMMPLLQAFPFPSTLGEVTLHQLSQACMFIYSSHGKWVFPLLQWSFHPTTTLTNFPTPDCWACATAPAFSSQLVYLQLTGKWSSPLSCGVFLSLPLLQAFLLLITGHVLPLLPSPAGLFIYSSCGYLSFPLSCGVFLPPLLLQAFPLLIAGHVPPLLFSPASL
jgi:hypothetical protein